MSFFEKRDHIQEAGADACDRLDTIGRAGGILEISRPDDIVRASVTAVKVAEVSFSERFQYTNADGWAIEVACRELALSLKFEGDKCFSLACSSEVGRVQDALFQRKSSEDNFFRQRRACQKSLLFT